MANSIVRQRTKMFKKDKITYVIEYRLDYLEFYIAYGSHINIRLENNRLYEKDIAIKLLNIFYDLLNMEISEIQDFLNIKIKDDKITDKKGNIISLIKLKGGIKQ